MTGLNFRYFMRQPCIYGGLAYEKAQNNKVVISNSFEWGNVQGGVSFLNDVLREKEKKEVLGEKKYVWIDNAKKIDEIDFDAILKIFNQN